jgi:hypothetical protein
MSAPVFFAVFKSFPYRGLIGNLKTNRIKIYENFLKNMKKEKRKNEIQHTLRVYALKQLFLSSYRSLILQHPNMTRVDLPF